MKFFSKLLIFLLILGNIQYLVDLDSSQYAQRTNLEAHKSSAVIETSIQNPSKVVFCEWQIKLHENGTASGRLEITLNWTGNKEFFRLTKPRTMEFLPSERVKNIKIVPYTGESLEWVDIYPELVVNTTDSIICEIYWPIASHFFRDQWFFPAYEYLPLMPDDHEITTEKMRAVVVFPAGTKEDTIDVIMESHQKFNKSITNTTLILEATMPKTSESEMPPIVYTGPPKPVGHDIEKRTREYSVVFPTVFEPKTKTILERINNVSSVLKRWLDRPEHHQPISIIFVPPYKVIPGIADEIYNRNNRSIFIRGAAIYGLIDPLRDSRYVLQGLQSLAQQMTSSYSLQRGAPDFFQEALAQFGMYHCLLELGYNITAAELVGKNLEPQNIDSRIWSWKWDPALNEQKRFDEKAFTILYNLTVRINSTGLFKEFFIELEKDQIQFVDSLQTMDKWGLFVHYLSKAAGVDLFPYFNNWGLQVNSSKNYFIHVSYFIILGLMVFALMGYAGKYWITRQWDKTELRISLVLMAMFGPYLILPTIFPWISNQTIGEVFIILYYSFFITLFTTCILCALAVFIFGRFWTTFKSQKEQKTL